MSSSTSSASVGDDIGLGPNPGEVSEAGTGTGRIVGGGIGGSGGGVVHCGDDDDDDFGGIGGGVDAGRLLVRPELEFWREKLLRLIGDDVTL